MTRLEQRSKRPEGWEEVKASYNRRELTMKEAASKLGISIQWFNVLLRRDEPGRKGFQHDHGVAIGKANKKYTSCLEQNFTDYELCMMIKSRANCSKCPLSCKGYMKYTGLGKKLVERVPLKDPSKPLEEA